MLDQYDKITEATTFIRARWSREPKVAIILGSGLGGISEALSEAVTISYDEIPHFARSTAHGHAGRFVCGLLEGVPVVVMEGRMHAYEGYPLQQITFPFGSCSGSEPSCSWSPTPAAGSTRSIARVT